MAPPGLFIFFIPLILTFSTDVQGQMIYASPNPAPVDSNVTLSSTANTSLTIGSWSFEGTTILFVYPGIPAPLISDAWQNRVQYNASSSALTLTSVQLTDSGLYQLEEFNSFTAELQLSVQVPISNVTLVAQPSVLVEYNDTAVLLCSVSNGTSLTYEWFNDDTAIVADGRFQTSNGGSVLSIVNVTRYDSGPFRCNVSNGISHDISSSVHLNISYGPSNASMSIMPEELVYRTGSDITLTCTAESSPAAAVQWMVDEKSLNGSEAELRLMDVKEEDAGSYKCVFSNRVTARFSSVSMMIQIEAPISAVMVNDSGVEPIHEDSFTLSCEVHGSFHQIEWWRNGHMVTASNTTSFGVNNKTLILNPVQRSDSGDYRCRAFNAVSNGTSDPYSLMVNYGPMMAVIQGPTSALVGSTVMLNCTSDSHPPSQHSWHFNDTLVASGSVYYTGPLSSNMSGEYTCLAFNNITGKNSSTTTTLEVFEPVTMATVVGSVAVMNQTFNLTCVTRGSVRSISWMYEGMPLYPGGSKNLSMDNRILTFDPVMRSDDGNYSCEASNPHSSFTSGNFTLTVSYGPEMPTIMGPRFGRVGGNVTLTCTASSHPPSQYLWLHNNMTLASSSHLMIHNLTTSMNGTYTCMAHNPVTGLTSSAHMTLTVYEPIQTVRVEPPTSPAVEDGAHELRCLATGYVERVSWMKDGEPLVADRRTVVNMTDHTVTFDPVQRNDSGLYQCMAMNPYENMTSAAYELAVNYGPDPPVIDGPSHGETGQSVVLTCSASSLPPAEFSWWFNGTLIAGSPVLTTGGLFLNMSGEYTCMASNNVTGKNSTNSKTLTVIETIQSVRVINNSIPIDGENFTLTCEVDGPYDSIHWMKGNVSLGTNGSNPQVSNSSVNSTIHFRPLTLEDDGLYQCVAANIVRQHRSPSYHLLANFGPMNISITGPDSAEEGTMVTMTCAAVSRPDPDFKWTLPDPSSSNDNKATITFEATKSTEGTYSCEARNPITNMVKKESKSLTVSDAAFQFTSQNFIMLTGLMFSYLALLLP